MDVVTNLGTKMKKIVIGLLVLLGGLNTINCMEVTEEPFALFDELPTELRYKIIATILEDTIDKYR